MYQLQPIAPRVARMRKRYRTTQPKLCTARFRIVTDFYRENPQITGILKKAKCFETLCQKMPIQINEDEVIVGSVATTYRGSAMYPEYGMHWFVEDYNNGLVPNRSLDPYIIDEEDIQYILSCADFWAKNSLSAKVDAYLPEGYRCCVGNGVTTFGGEHNCATPIGHFCAGYEKIMHTGFRAVQQEAQEKMAELEGVAFDDSIDKYHFYRAVSIVAGAMCTLAQRYAAECLHQAEGDVSAERRQELLDMADSLGWIMEHPCRTFQDAVQSMYLYHIALCLDGNMHGLSLGRVDQYLAPYYEADIAAGRTTPERAQEVLDLFFLKLAELNKFWATALTHAIAGYTSGCLMTLGGVDKEGKDATNAVTYMMLQSAGRLVLHDPPLALRVHKNTPAQLWQAALETTSRAGGVPTFQNDEVIIPSLVDNRGMTLEDARNYSIIGCVEPAGTGNSWPECCGTGGEGYWNMANAFLLAINNGVNPMSCRGELEGPRTGAATGYLYDMENFEDVLKAVEKQFAYFINWQVTLTNSFEYVAAREMPLPLASATIDGCMQSGRDVMQGGSKYNSTGFPGVGVGTVADCLTALKYMVYDKKKLTPREFYDVLRSDWKDREDLRQYVLNEVPHYGNGDPYADEMATWVSDTFARLVTATTSPRGCVAPGLYPITFHVVFGKETAATPDGRKAGDPLSDGISPVQSLDKNGPTGIMSSASRLHQVEFSNGTLHNMKFHPTVLNSDEGREKLLTLIRTYFDLGGMQLQFNIVSAELLRHAQAHPEEHQDLVIRIAGFSAYFVEVYKECQDEIIKRTELSV